MQKNKVSQIISAILMMLFSTLTFVLNFSFLPKSLIYQQDKKLIEQIMQKESTLLADYDYVKNNYIIKTKNDLLDFSKAVNSGVTHVGLTVKLGCNINLNGETFSPIGTGLNNNNEHYSFKGNFDGQNYRIENLKISSSNETTYLGLFGYVCNSTLYGVTIKNLTVVVNTIKQENNYAVGAIVGCAYTNNWNVLIKNCIVLQSSTESKIISKKSAVGGVVGLVVNQADKKRCITCSYCANYVNIVCESSAYAIGGIIGETKNVVSKSPNVVEFCYFNADIKISTILGVCAGGIVGKDVADVGVEDSINIKYCVSDAYFGVISDDKEEITDWEINDNYNPQDPSNSGSMSYYEKYYADYAITTKNSTLNMYVGGIIGYGAGEKTCVSYSFNYLSGASVLPKAEISGDVMLVHGVGDVDENTSIYTHFNFKRIKTMFNGIGFNCTTNNSHSYTHTISESLLNVEECEHRTYAKIFDNVNSSGTISTHAVPYNERLQSYEENVCYLFEYNGTKNIDGVNCHLWTASLNGKVGVFMSCAKQSIAWSEFIADEDNTYEYIFESKNVNCTSNSKQIELYENTETNGLCAYEYKYKLNLDEKDNKLCLSYNVIQTTTIKLWSGTGTTSTSKTDSYKIFEVDLDNADFEQDDASYHENFYNFDLSTISEGETHFVMSGGKPHLKWLRWINNYSAPVSEWWPVGVLFAFNLF